MWILTWNFRREWTEKLNLVWVYVWECRKGKDNSSCFHMMGAYSSNIYLPMPRPCRKAIHSILLNLSMGQATKSIGMMRGWVTTLCPQHNCLSYLDTPMGMKSSNKANLMHREHLKSVWRLVKLPHTRIIREHGYLGNYTCTLKPRVHG
jgi:hypothetical protein